MDTSFFLGRTLLSKHTVSRGNCYDCCSTSSTSCSSSTISSSDRSTCSSSPSSRKTGTRKLNVYLLILPAVESGWTKILEDVLV